MEIALANMQDVNRIAELYSKLYAHVNKKKEASEKKKSCLINYVQLRLHRPNYSIYVFKINNQIVGTAAIKMLSSKKAFLTDAFVEPEFRRKGIMREFEIFIIGILKEKGIFVIELGVKESNMEGASTWKSLGYKIIKEIPKRLGNKFIMKKKF